MTAAHWKASHIVSIAAMAALVMFLVLSAVAGESSSLLSSTTVHPSVAEQTATEVYSADRSS